MSDWDKLASSSPVNRTAWLVTSWWNGEKEQLFNRAFVLCPRVLNLDFQIVKTHPALWDLVDHSWFETNDGRVLWIKEFSLNRKNPGIVWVIECKCWKFSIMRSQVINKVKRWIPWPSLWCFDCMENGVHNAAQV